MVHIDAASFLLSRVVWPLVLAGRAAASFVNLSTVLDACLLGKLVYVYVCMCVLVDNTLL